MWLPAVPGAWRFYAACAVVLGVLAAALAYAGLRGDTHPYIQGDDIRNCPFDEAHPVPPQVAASALAARQTIEELFTLPAAADVTLSPRDRAAALDAGAETRAATVRAVFAPSAQAKETAMVEDTIARMKDSWSPPALYSDYRVVRDNGPATGKVTAAWACVSVPVHDESYHPPRPRIAEGSAPGWVRGPRYSLRVVLERRDPAARWQVVGWVDHGLPH